MMEILLDALNGATQDIVSTSPLTHGLDQFSITSAALIGYAGVGIIMYGTIRSFFQFLASIIGKQKNLSRIRIDLGKHLALGLEFFVGKDIIESVVHPTWDDLGKLGAIIVLRTVVTIFLSRELKEVEQEIKVEQEEIALRREQAKEASMIKHRQQKS